MSTVTMNVHDVTKVHVDDVRALPGLGGRFCQTFTFTAADGSRNEINIFFDKDRATQAPASFFDPE